MKLIQYFCLLLLLVIGVGCEENMPLTYEGKDAVYIYSTNHTRTTEQTFFLNLRNEIRSGFKYN